MMIFAGGKINQFENLAKKRAVTPSHSMQESFVNIQYEFPARFTQAAGTKIKGMNRSAQPIKCDQMLIA